MLPNKHFIIIGAQRSGSTLLQNMLEEHPAVYMASPSRPEPKYFMQNEVSYKEYLDQFFAARSGETILGEKSTSYYETPLAARQIKATISDCRILAILRNPVYRAISNYHFSRSFGLEKRSLKGVFVDQLPSPSQMTTSVNPFHYLERGLYCRHLEVYRKLFGEQLKVIVLEELLRDERIVHGVSNFLEISAEPLLDFHREMGKTNNLEYPKTEASIIAYLFDYFEAPNRDLAREYQLDLSYWQGPTETQINCIKENFRE